MLICQEPAFHPAWSTHECIHSAVFICATYSHPTLSEQWSFLGRDPECYTSSAVHSNMMTHTWIQTDSDFHQANPCIVQPYLKRRIKEKKNIELQKVHSVNKRVFRFTSSLSVTFYPLLYGSGCIYVCNERVRESSKQMHVEGFSI